MFKKYVSTTLMAAMLAVMIPAMSGTAAAQTKRYYNNRARTNYVYKKPNVYRRHRKAFNIGLGTGTGLLVGGLLGGKKGALIGALAGAGGGAIFTHVQKPKNRVRYYRQY